MAAAAAAATEMPYHITIQCTVCTEVSPSRLVMGQSGAILTVFTYCWSYSTASPIAQLLGNSVQLLVGTIICTA